MERFIKFIDDWLFVVCALFVSSPILFFVGLYIYMATMSTEDRIKLNEDAIFRQEKDIAFSKERIIYLKKRLEIEKQIKSLQENLQTEKE